jgi:DNA-binding FrmR family transcriptional regulator
MKEQYRKNLAKDFKYAEGQIEGCKKSIERLKQDIQNIKSR